jgi:methylmalonyl-CoA mutase
MENVLFKDFTKADKTAWLKAVEKELKGKNLQDLNLQIGESLTIEPYYTFEDIQNIDHAILSHYNPDWQVGEEFEVEDVATANKELLAALMNGVSAPTIRLNTSLHENKLTEIFSEVGLQYIDTHIAFGYETESFSNFLNQWQKLLQQKEIALTDASLFLDFDPLSIENNENLSDFVAMLKKYAFSNLKLIHINGFNLHTNEHNVLNELDTLLEKTEQYFIFLQQNQIDLSIAAQQMHFTLAIGKSYFIEIAKLRAFKLRFTKLLEKYNLPPFLPFVTVKFAHTAYGADKHDNLINATTLAMSAILGGANHIVVRPTGETTTDKRLARNVQLILKHESGMHHVADPARGSYYIEMITNMLS